MDIALLLLPEVRKYILENTGTDLTRLAFSKNPFPGIDHKLILGQIEARAKSHSKLPSWYAEQDIIYPSKISLEQTSSEVTAAYKSGLVGGKSLIDLTGGFGVDDYYFSKKVKEVIHCEMNGTLSQIAAHNFRLLGADNISCKTGDSLEILQNAGQPFDWIYIDPSRRNDSKGKVFLLSDCEPNVPELLGLYFRYASKILIKTAPLLDIAAGLSQLRFVKCIHVIAIENDVKELLWELQEGHQEVLQVKTVNCTKKGNQFFEFRRDQGAAVAFSLPKKYLYEPNAAIMKSAGFSQLGEHLQVEKLHPNSHLFTSDEVIDFPGRRFEIIESLAPNSAESRKKLKGARLHVTVRNFPETVEQIRKKWKITEGRDRYAFFTTDRNDNKIVLLCAKLAIE